MRALRAELGVLHDKNWDPQQSLATLKNFAQLIAPALGSAIKGDHRIELGNRLSSGAALKEEAPFFKAETRSLELHALPLNSAVHEPIQAAAHLPGGKGSPLGIAVTAHLKKLSRKTAEQKTLCVKDN